MTNMSLEIEGHDLIENVGENQIENALSVLHQPSPTFLILKNIKNSYLKASITRSGTFELEYYEDSMESIQFSKRSNYSKEEITTILKLFYSWDNNWQNNIEWRNIERPNRIDIMKYISIASIILLMIILLRSKFSKTNNNLFLFDMDSLSEFTLLSWLAFLGALNTLRNIDNVHGRSKALAISSVILVVVSSMISIIRFIIFIFD